SPTPSTPRRGYSPPFQATARRAFSTKRSRENLPSLRYRRRWAARAEHAARASSRRARQLERDVAHFLAGCEDHLMRRASGNDDHVAGVKRRACCAARRTAAPFARGCFLRTLERAA